MTIEIYFTDLSDEMQEYIMDELQLSSLPDCLADALITRISTDNLELLLEEEKNR